MALSLFRAKTLVKTAAVLLVAVSVAGCARDYRLKDLRPSGDGPEEFGIEPVKPLEKPASYSALPAPTPGARNRTDKTPLEDSVAALGGNPARLATGGGIPASDAALVNAASRKGTNPAIRQQLAAEDLEFRKRKSRFTKFRLFRVDRYNQSYRRQSLNAQRTTDLYRRAGARTPSAPPQ